MSTLKVDTIKSDTTPTITISDGLSVSGVSTNTNSVVVNMASSTEMIKLDVSGTNFARIGHNSSSGVAVLDVRSEGHMRVLTGGNNEFLRITQTGDFGIGNNSPSCKLAVKDTAEHTAYANATPSVGDCMFQLYNNPSNETANDHASIQFGVNGGTHNRVSTISAVAESASNRKLALTFCTDSGNNRNERVRIGGDGKVGIGTTNPGAELHAYHATSNTIAQFESGDAGAGAIWKDNSTYSSIEQNGTDFIISADQGASHANSALSFKVDTSEKLRITSAGAWGIGGANYGTSGQVLTSGGSGAAVSWAAASGGPTHYSKFTLESVQGNQNPINNWDLYSPGISPTINTAVTNTNGVFSFPATGIWECQASILFYLNGGTTEFRLETYGTTDDGSSWDIIGRQYGWFHNNSSTNYMSVSTMPFLLDITNTSNCKVKFVIAGGPGTLYTGGDDNDLYSGCHFIRWADT